MKNRLVIGSFGILVLLIVVFFITQFQRPNLKPTISASNVLDALKADPPILMSAVDEVTAGISKEYADAKVGDCDYLFEPGEIEAVRDEHYPQLTVDQMCGMALEYANSIRKDTANREIAWRDSEDAKYFPQGILNSDYLSYDDATLMQLLKTDAAAAFVLGNRYINLDPDQAQQYYFQSAKLSGLPGPLLMSFVYRSNVSFTEDPISGERSYNHPERLFNAAVYATLVQKLDYDYELTSDLRDHVRRALGPDILEEVDIEADALFKEIKTGGAL